MRLPLVFTLVLLLFSLIVDAYIAWRIPKARVIKGKNVKVRRSYIISSVIFAALLVVCVCMPKRDNTSSLLPVMWMLYAWSSIYFPKVIYALFDLLGRIPALFRRKAWPLGLYVGFPLGVICFVAMWWGAIAGRRQIMVTEETITSEKLPESFDGFRIVQFSDAHVGTWGEDTAFIAELVSRINSLKPDLIVFTGDLVNRFSDEAIPFVDVLGRLRAPYGVYSVMGNHDYGDYSDWPTEAEHLADAEHLRALERKMGWHLLDNSHVFLRRGNDSIALIGVENWGEPPFKQYGDMRAAYPHNEAGNIADPTFKILLSHNPMHWHESVRHNTDIDLTLAGHTHAMQMLIGRPGSGISPSSWRYPEWGGLYEYHSKKTSGQSSGSSDITSRLYVNIGCGEVAIPARIGASPEITLITLHKKQ